MNKAQEAKLNMYKAVISYYETGAENTPAMPALTANFGEFKSTVTAIIDTVQLKAKIISGYAGGKHNTRKELEEEAVLLAGLVYSIAKTANNNVLWDSVNYKPTELKRLRDRELAAVCINIWEAARLLIAELRHYNIMATDIKRFHKKIVEFSKWIPMPRNAISQRSAYVAKLSELFKAADDLLKHHIDRQVNAFKKIYPAFYAAYKNNRKIIDNGNTASQVKGTIVNKTTRKLIVGATITLLENETSVTSGTDGIYSIKPVSPATYTMKVDMEGFESEIIKGVVVKSGKTAKVVVKLIPK